MTRVDVADLGSVERAFAATMKHVERLDILVNNAGVSGPVLPVWEYPPEEWHRVLAVDLTGVFHCCRVAVPVMRAAGYGRIVNATSGALIGARYVTIYGAAKGAVLSLTRGLAIEGNDHGIKVNTLGPAALTIALSHLSKPEVVKLAAPAELVAPVVAYLAHRDCPITGGYFESSAGTTTFRHFSETAGYSNPELTLEDVRDHFDEIVDLSTSTVVPEALDHPWANAIDPKPYQPD